MRELTIIIIPATVLNVGYSPGSIIQLSTAPNIGLINLHILISLTLAPLLCKAINQTERKNRDKYQNGKADIESGRFPDKGVISFRT